MKCLECEKNSIRGTWRKFLHYLGVPLVWLIDFNGERHLRVRRKQKCGKHYWAVRMFSIHYCGLNSDGTTSYLNSYGMVVSDKDYVKRWENYAPCDSKKSI